MILPSSTDAQLLQAERDLARAERQLGLAQTHAATVRAELKRSEFNLAQERVRAGQLQAALNQVYASTSWRLSRPVRVASRIIAVIRARKLPPPAAIVTAPLAPPAASAPQTILPTREAAILQRLQRRAV